MTEQQIYDKLVPLITEISGARPEQITMQSNLVRDLGAESVDLLDLSFLIEETFGVGIDADEFEQQATKKMNGAEYARDGVLTDHALDHLKRALPEVPADQFRSGLKKIEIPMLLSVAVFVHLIQRKLDEKKSEVSHA